MKMYDVTQSERRAKVRLASALGPSLKLQSAHDRSEDKTFLSAVRGDDPAEADEVESTVLKVQGCDPLPTRLDPVTQALLAGVDETARHQALTLAVPILAFLGHKVRVDYGDGTLRWVCGQSWQMGGSGCGKSLMLRALEQLFLARELRENDDNSRRIAEYSALPEKERAQKPMPKLPMRVMNTVPTAISLLSQMQVNGDGVVYLSCSECGEFGKKISQTYYCLVLDMMKKSYDGTGEPFMHKNSNNVWYVPSMKLCANVGGTIDPMYSIFRRCNADGTLSRGNLTMLGERKSPDAESPYRPPSWNEKQRSMLMQAAQRLRDFDNTYRENENETYENYIEEQKQSGGAFVPPTMDEYHQRVLQRRLENVLSLPRVLELGKVVKAYVAQYGDLADDSCSRADERAMGLAYLLCVCNDCVFENTTDSTGNDSRQEIVEQICNTCFWWIRQCVDYAVAMQRRINQGVRSVKDDVRAAYKSQALKRFAESLRMTREESFRKLEEEHDGEELGWQAIADMPGFKGLKRMQLSRLMGERYTYLGRNLYKITKQTTDETHEMQ